MNMVKRLTAAAFALLLLLPLLTFRREAGVASEADNRMLQENPFSAEERAKGGDLTAKLERYVGDRIGFRDEMILGFQLLNDRLFGKLTHPSYCYGKEGHVYYAPNTADNSEAYYTAFAEMIRQIQEYCEARSVPFLFVIEAAKEAVLPEYLPEGERYDRRRLERMCAQLDEWGVRYLDTAGLLRERTEAGEEVFNRKYDAGHWNDLGGFYVVNAVLEELGKDLPGLRPNRLEDMEVSRVTQEWLMNSRFPISEEVPSIGLPDRVREDTGSGALAGELEMIHRTFGAVRDPWLLERGAPRGLIFQVSHMNTVGGKFFMNALGEYTHVTTYYNVDKFEYYFNIFQPECVVVEMAEAQFHGATPVHLEDMLAMRLNPTLESALAEAGEPETLPLEGLTVQEGEALTKFFWDGAGRTPSGAEEAPCVWAVLDGTAYDMRESEGGGWEATVKNEDWARGGGAPEIYVLDDGSMTRFAP